MRSSTKTLILSLLAAIALFTLVQPANAVLPLAYCSSQNTGSNNPDLFWTWQSHGWCFDQCKDNYAFGIVLKNDCWCSNYIPEDQQDVSKCSLDCPGFPDEKCGNEDNQLYGYVALNKQPSGTQSLSQRTSTSTPSQRLSSATSTTFETSTSLSSFVTRLSTAVEVVTISNRPVTQSVIRTVVITPSPTPITQTQRKSTPVGPIVGGVLGGIAVIGAIVGGVFFMLWRRRRRQQQQQQDDDGQSGIQRNVSTLSKDGLLRTGQVTEHPPKIATVFNRHSRIIHDGDSISPISASDRRSSRPYIFDQRLNPSAIMSLDNNSRGSFVSMDDSHDYGRTLNVRNPDPNPST